MPAQKTAARRPPRRSRRYREIGRQAAPHRPPAWRRRRRRQSTSPCANSPFGTGAPRLRSLERKRLLVKLAGHGGNILTRGLVIAAPRSGSGKTMLTLGLMRSYRNAGLAVAGAKCGPDYIDPAFHAAATGKPSFNLDSWAMCPALLGALAVAAGEACGLVLCEGVMGLFDGVAGEPGRTGSSPAVVRALLAGGAARGGR